MLSVKKISYPLALSLFFLPACSLVKKTEKLFNPKPQAIEVKVTKKKTIFISCNNGNVQKYLDDGWKIVDTSSKDVACSWKEEKSSPKCNINKDKGCKITVPDKMGKQIKYLLEKDSKKK